MHNVIDFAARLNARRAAAELDRRADATFDRLQRRAHEIAAAAPVDLGTAIEVAAQEQAARQPKFVPAYCDPANETRGSKYDATRNLPLTEIAKRIRADIKALGLAPGITISVRVHHHSSIDIRVAALPPAFPMLTDKAASWRKQFGEWRDYPFAYSEARAPELAALLDQLDRIHGSYNRDNSDSMSDYFDVRYYGNAEIDGQLRRDREAEQIAANPGTYWADEA